MIELTDDTTSLDPNSIENLVDLNHIRKIFQSLSKITKFTISMVSIPENKKIISTPNHKICSQFHKANSESSMLCVKSDYHLYNSVEFKKEICIQVCRNGMIDAAIPIIIDEKHHANIIIGQVLIGRPQNVFFERQAKKYNYDLELYMQALREVPITTEDEIKAALIFLHDIVSMEIEQNLKKIELTKEKDKADIANKCKSEYLANISHELRTHLHGILSFARYGIEESKNPNINKETLTKNFDEINNAGNELLTILNDILDLAKLEAGKVDYYKKSNDIACFVDYTFSEMDIIAQEKKITFEMKIKSPNIKTIAHFDAIKIQQVLKNLISNAIKFSYPGSIIKVEIENISQNQKEYMLISVINRGEQIPKDKQEIIFEKYKQNNNINTTYGSSGLGLSICKQIVEDHDGKIWAQNTPDGETQFSFMIPKDSQQDRQLDH